MNTHPNIDFNPVESKVDLHSDNEDEQDFDLDEIERQLLLLQMQLDGQSLGDEEKSNPAETPFSGFILEHDTSSRGLLGDGGCKSSYELKLEEV